MKKLQVFMKKKVLVIASLFLFLSTSILIAADFSYQAHEHGALVTGTGDILHLGGGQYAGGSGKVQIGSVWNNTFSPLVTVLTEGMNGKMGIGTINPERLLHLNGANAQILTTTTDNNAGYAEIIFGEPTTKLAAAVGWDAYWNKFFVRNNANLSATVFEVNNNNTMIEAMRIHPYGNVGIGTTDPQAKLHVAGDVKIDGNIVANNLQGVNLTVQNLTASATISANTYSCSDLRYKKDITPVASALEKISLLKGVYYNWKTVDFKDKGFSDKRDMGFIAQDLEKVFPEVVFTDSTGYKSVAYSKLTAVIVEAIKEHKQETDSYKKAIGSLQKQNAELKQRIASLEKMNERVAQLENMIKLSAFGMQ